MRESSQRAFLTISFLANRSGAFNGIGFYLVDSSSAARFAGFARSADGCVMVKKIALIGYRATGKSSVAKRLSERLRLPHVDSDAVVAKQTGKSIAQIFDEDGEECFRELEARAVSDALHSPDSLVLATGGGAPLRESTRNDLKNHSIVIWLVAPVNTIAERMRGDSGTESSRPSLTGVCSPVDEIETVLKEREPLYRDAATHIVDVENKTIEMIVDEIARLTQDADE